MNCCRGETRALRLHLGSGILLIFDVDGVPAGSATLLGAKFLVVLADKGSAGFIGTPSRVSTGCL